MFPIHPKSSSRQIPRSGRAAQSTNPLNRGGGSNARRFRRDGAQTSTAPVSQSVPLPRSRQGQGPYVQCPRAPNRRPREPMCDPPKCVLPPSPQEFSQMEMEAAMEIKSMNNSSPYQPRSLPSDFASFDEMSRSLKNSFKDRFNPTISPLIEKPSPENSLADGMTDLTLSSSATVLSVLMGSVDSTSGDSTEELFAMQTSSRDSNGSGSDRNASWDAYHQHQWVRDRENVHDADKPGSYQELQFDLEEEQS